MAGKIQGEIRQACRKRKSTLLGFRLFASATNQAEGRQPKLMGCFRLTPICCSAACLRPAPFPSLSLKQRAIRCICLLAPQPSSLPEREQSSEKEAYVGPRGQKEQVKASQASLVCTFSPLHLSQQYFHALEFLGKACDFPE